MKLASLIRIFLPFSGILGGPVVVPTKPGMDFTATVLLVCTGVSAPKA